MKKIFICREPICPPDSYNIKQRYSEPPDESAPKEIPDAQEHGAFKSGCQARLRMDFHTPCSSCTLNNPGCLSARDFIKTDAKNFEVKRKSLSYEKRNIIPVGTKLFASLLSAGLLS